ncbi:PREDICTED: uncharacterized protein LOC109152898 [Ipomoea nil]|uniref:uncharacterized protein LOC109152898 n=1 Tax=Ipomoea nil TaxID=35883 RepID=UPI000901AA5F|nr:PREDICTED: uncharacterized protein LOC109152898 [Ipomoea nil]
MASEISFKPMFSDLQFEFDESEDCWVRKPIFSDLQFEFDESEDCWVRGDDKVAVVSETRWSPTTVLPNGGGSSVVEQVAVTAVGVKSVPMKIPDWRRILGVAFQQDQRARQDSDYNAPWSVEEDEYLGLPPHLYLARTRVASLSGRSVKGRDLWRLRNAIWKQIGFED